MSFYKKDFIAVNGFNNDFVGWGHEDSEFALRMLNNGCKKNYIKYHCMQFHLYHPERNREMDLIHWEYLKKQITIDAKWCENGIDRFLTSYKDYVRE